MTKKEALKQFLEPGISFLGINGRIDHCARQQAWNDYTDMLCKEGKITLKQYESWTNPF